MLLPFSAELHTPGRKPRVLFAANPNTPFARSRARATVTVFLRSDGESIVDPTNVTDSPYVLLSPSFLARCTKNVLVLRQEYPVQRDPATMQEVAHPATVNPSQQEDVQRFVSFAAAR
jgi:hypothetical protein